MSEKKKPKSVPKLTAGAKSGDEQKRMVGPDLREGETPQRDDPDPLEMSWQRDDKKPNLLGLAIEARIKPVLRKAQLSAARDAAAARELQRAEEIAAAEHERRMADLRRPVESAPKVPAQLEDTSVREAAKPSQCAPAVEQEFSADADYRNIRWRGTGYSLTPGQAKVIRLLHEAHLNGFRGVSKTQLMEALETEKKFPSRLQDLFPKSDPNHVLWSNLIIRIQGRKDIYTLKIEQQPPLPAQK